MGSAVFPVVVRNACAWMQTAIEALAVTVLSGVLRFTAASRAAIKMERFQACRHVLDFCELPPAAAWELV